MTASQGFHWVDYVVFATVLGISFVVGIIQRFTGNKQKSVEDYLQGSG